MGSGRSQLFANQDRLKKMLREALEENAPQMSERLRKAGDLERWIEARANWAEDEFNEQMSLMSQEDTKRIVSAQNEGYLQTVQARSARQKQIEERVLEQALEFPPVYRTSARRFGQ